MGRQLQEAFVENTAFHALRSSIEFDSTASGHRALGEKESRLVSRADVVRIIDNIERTGEPMVKEVADEIVRRAQSN